MLALCLMLLVIYYALNYAGIIGLGLLAIIASSHFHSSFLPSLTAGKLEGHTGLLVMGTLNSLVLIAAGSTLVYF